MQPRLDCSQLLTICDSSVQDLLIVQHPFFWHFRALTHAYVLRQVEDFLGHIPRRIISTQSLGGALHERRMDQNARRS